VEKSLSNEEDEGLVGKGKASPEVISSKHQKGLGNEKRKLKPNEKVSASRSPEGRKRIKSPTGIPKRRRGKNLLFH